MRRLQVALTGWLLLAACAVSAAPVTAPPDTLPTPAFAEDSGRGPWLVRTLKRFLGNRAPSGQDLDGRALELVDRYARDSGRLIEVVLVYQVDRFREGWNRDKAYSRRLFTNLTGPLQTYTRDGVIRETLLFAAGDLVDPFLLADSERLLRELPFISDARIQVVPLEGGEGVAVVVETTDRWPLGLDARVIGLDSYVANLYTVNLAGTGIGLSNELIRERDSECPWGYRGRLRRRNLGGSFLDGELEFEDSFARLRRRVQVERRLSHPGIRAVGGLSLERTVVRDGLLDPSRSVLLDAWGGGVLHLYERRSRTRTARPILIPAVRFLRRDFLDRPAVRPDSNQIYHDRTWYLAGLTFQRLKHYRTSFLYGDGETEDVPAGLTVKVTAGYEDGEYARRSGLFLESGWTSLRNRGELVTANLAVGAYWRNRRAEDGVGRASVAWVTPLHGQDRYRRRLFVGLDYTLGIGRGPFDRLFLDDATGLRDLEPDQVAGNQRLVGTVEARVFTPWSLLGFRTSLSAFADVGMIGAEDAASILQEKIYTSTGLGFSLRNPDLVLPTLRARLSLVRSVRTSGIQVVVAAGSGVLRGLPVIDARPDALDYR